VEAAEKEAGTAQGVELGVNEPLARAAASGRKPATSTGCGRTQTLAAHIDLVFGRVRRHLALSPLELRTLDEPLDQLPHLLKTGHVQHALVGHVGREAAGGVALRRQQCEGRRFGEQLLEGRP